MIVTFDSRVRTVAMLHCTLAYDSRHVHVCLLLGGGPSGGQGMIRVLNDGSQQARLLLPVDLKSGERLRIGKIPWHTGHDYELAKMPVDFLVAGDTHRAWATSQRPVPANVKFVSSDALAEADVLILHVDQWILQEIDKLTAFRRCLEFDVPKVIINHGCNMVDGCTSQEMQNLVGGHFVVCNSSTAHSLWGIKNSIYIHHGMDPDEWPQTNYGRQNIIITQPHSGIHQSYRNNDAIVAFEALTGTKVDWVGRDVTFNTFAKYRSFLSRSSIYFNPSFASPNPRARTEAMLCGLVPVTTDSHGESDYIVNGVNGYCSNNIDELFQYLLELKQNPNLCRELGMAARKTASERFHISRFVSQWQSVLNHVAGRSFNV
ncbi:MAG: glycosyltransferase family 4 protein [Enhydrobacter sp.]|nr:glycosyltransferase family 4 protein [Enhydrobacter sp.]